MNERLHDVAIPGTDLHIEGTLHEVNGVPDAPLVILVHGFTGHRNEHIFFNGARRFATAGFASYRFDLYSDQPRTRSFLDCTVEMHAADLDTVVASFRQEHPDRPISVVGHSLGAPSVLSSVHRDFRCVVLWDPSHGDRGADNFSGHNPWAQWSDELGTWLLDDHVPMLAGKPMSDSWAAHATDHLLADLDRPVKLIAAGADVLVPVVQHLYDVAAEPKAFALVDGADHCFNIGDTADRLHDETLDWLERHGR